MEKGRQKSHANSRVQKKAAEREVKADLDTLGTRSRTRVRGAGRAVV